MKTRAKSGIEVMEAAFFKPHGYAPMGVEGAAMVPLTSKCYLSIYLSIYKTIFKNYLFKKFCKKLVFLLEDNSA